MSLQMPNNGPLTGKAVLLNSNHVWLFNLPGKFILPYSEWGIQDELSVIFIMIKTNWFQLIISVLQEWSKSLVALSVIAVLFWQRGMRACERVNVRSACVGVWMDQLQGGVVGREAPCRLVTTTKFIGRSASFCGVGLMMSFVLLCGLLTA